MNVYVYIYIYQKNILYNVIDKTLQILEQPINEISSKVYRMLTKYSQSVYIYIYIPNVHIYLCHIIPLTFYVIYLIAHIMH